MTTVEAPERHDGPHGEEREWSYGTTVERPLDGTAELTQSLADPEAETTPAEEAAQPPVPSVKPAPGHPEQAEAGAKGDDPAEAQEEAPPSPPRKLVFVIAGLVLVLALAWGAYTHWRTSSSADETQTQTANDVPEVRTTAAKRVDTPIDITLPGQTEAFDAANIYPRATGYITIRKVDIGSRVKKGDLLVHITAPDLDQQLAQAKAQLGQFTAAETQAEAQVNQAEANLNLAKVTLARTATLTQQGYATLQTRDNDVANQQSQQAMVDTAKAGVKVADANTKAQQATVDRLAALAGFEDVLAPFDGVITTRNVDLGDLVNADTASVTPMFSIANEATIRVTVQVPQNSSSGVHEGVPATMEVPSSPGQQFAGNVTRSSVALLSSARTLDTEVDIANPNGQIRPGLFVYVTLHIPRTYPEVVVPAEALIFNQKGLQVATAEADKAHLRDVTIYRDFGTEVSLSRGLDGGEQVILSPPALLKDGSSIKVKTDDPPKPDGAAKPAPEGGSAKVPDEKGATKADAGKS